MLDLSNFLLSIYSSKHWVFVVLGGTLLIVELLGTSGYSLWSGISAFIVSIIAWLFPFSWPSLWILFAIFTLITAYIWWIWIKKQSKKNKKQNRLNQPKHDLIDTITTVTAPITNGKGRVKINDGSWLATCDEFVDINEKVKIIDVNGIILKVVKI